MSWRDETCHEGKTGFQGGAEEGIFAQLGKSESLKTRKAAPSLLHKIPLCLRWIIFVS